VSHNPKTFVKTNQKERERKNEKPENKQAQSNYLPSLSLDDQLEYFADLLIDIYFEYENN